MLRLSPRFHPFLLRFRGLSFVDALLLSALGFLAHWPGASRFHTASLLGYFAPDSALLTCLVAKGSSRWISVTLTRLSTFPPNPRLPL